jgi:hypothetical protein
MTCASRGNTLPQAAAFCPACGARGTNAEDALTVYTPADRTVALEFQPDSVREDDARLARVRGGVSVTIRVSHPNVCRVYDIGEADGHIFLSMDCRQRRFCCSGCSWPWCSGRCLVDSRLLD